MQNQKKKRKKFWSYLKIQHVKSNIRVFIFFFQRLINLKEKRIASLSTKAHQRSKVKLFISLSLFGKARTEKNFSCTTIAKILASTSSPRKKNRKEQKKKKKLQQVKYFMKYFTKVRNGFAWGIVFNQLRLI